MRLRLPCRSNAPGLLLVLCALPLAFGCAEQEGDAGGGPTFAFAEHFAPEDVLVEERAGETMLRLVGIGFHYDTADLTPDSLPVLDQLAAVFAELPGARYSIEAHTASPGSSAYNQALTEDRAEAVRDYLVEVVGGPAVAFTTIGYGEDVPIADNATKAGRALNSRVEIIVTADTGDPVFDITLAAHTLVVGFDCDAYTSSPEAAAGDFFIQAEIDSDDDRGLVLADRSPNTLVLANDGETIDLDIAAQGRFIASEDATLVGFIDWYESDPGGVHHFDVAIETARVWDGDLRCWIDPDERGEPECTDEEDGLIARGSHGVHSAGAVPCTASLQWAMWADRVRR